MSVKPCSRQPFNRPLIELNYKIVRDRISDKQITSLRGERKGHQRISRANANEYKIIMW